MWGNSNYHPIHTSANLSANWVQPSFLASLAWWIICNDDNSHFLVSCSKHRHVYMFEYLVLTWLYSSMQFQGRLIKCAMEVTHASNRTAITEQSDNDTIFRVWYPARSATLVWDRTFTFSQIQWLYYVFSVRDKTKKKKRYSCEIHTVHHQAKQSYLNVINN